MRVGAELPITAPSEAASAEAQKISRPAVAPTSDLHAAQQTEAPAESPKAAQAVQELDLSFRKDANGITYYVLTNPQSGQVVREVPAKEVREVSGGIEQYLKEQAAAVAHKTDSKA